MKGFKIMFGGRENTLRAAGIDQFGKFGQTRLDIPG